MANLPIEDPRILEAIEACRPGSDDVSDPALAFLAAQLAASPELDEMYERLQQVDAMIAEAFQDVPVPDGLADRIVNRVAAARSTQHASASDQSAGDELVTETGAAEPIAGLPGHGRRVSRRWLLAGAGALAMAVSVLVAVLVHRPEPVAYDPPEVWERAICFFDSDWDEEGRLVVEAQPPSVYPAGPDFDVSRFPEMRWRWIDDFLGHRGVAYDINRPGAPRATLYVVECTVPNLPDVPPVRSALTTRNRSTSAWQTDDLLYVLVVEGGRRTYEGFLPHRTCT